MVIRKFASSVQWFFSFAVILALLSPAAFANNAVATASVSRTNVAKDEVFQLKVSINKQVSNSKVDFSVLQPAFYMGRPSFGSYSNSINGKTTVSSEWTVALAATQTGILKIPSFDIDGVKTAPIAIQVTNDRNARTQDDVIQLTANIEKSDLYAGERTTLHTRLIIKADLRRLQNTNIESAFGEGLSIEPIGESNQYQSVVDGVEATVVDQSFYIIPERAGTFTLSPPRIKGALIESSGRSSGTRLIQIDKSAPAITLTVKEKPSTYQGAWLPTPSLSVDQLWQDDEGNRITSETFTTQVGSPVQRTLVIRAKNLSQQQMPNLKVTYPESIRVYDETPQFSQDSNGDIIMTVKQVLIAKETGQFELPAVSVRWWNSETGREQTSTASSMSVTIEKGDVSNLNSVVQPTLPQQTLTVTDSGFWPYLTALFAVLWLATSVLLWKTKHRSADVTPKPDNIKPNNFTAQLISAITNKDGIAFDRVYKEWAETVELSESVISQANAFRQSLYGKGTTTLDEQAFILAIKGANKRKVAKPSNVLPPL
ncbi:protein BatD [Vibrio sp. S9_S30]|uniref:BatD family protein n=1 Tax=Vibrio sp. S9_S30 TaxID=2720226 RepID=UPI001680B631|nr:BatD family protein [Vibrio sp. S9_S30]MBD1556233.1 protein BatD [Vibrio sp. S9_S30]